MASKLEPSERAQRELDLQRQWFSRIEGALHKNESGPLWLKDERVAKIVAEALHFYDNKTYRLDAYCIMPNHFHTVLAPLETVIENVDSEQQSEPRYVPLARIMHSIKSYTANQANKLLSRSGTFWQKESHDHVIKDHDEWFRVISYIANNPVKAGLVERWQDWQFTYIPK